MDAVHTGAEEQYEMVLLREAQFRLSEGLSAVAEDWYQLDPFFVALCSTYTRISGTAEED